MAAITPGADATRTRATQRDPQRAAPALAPADSSNKISRSSLFGITLLTIALIGSGFALLKSTSPSDADPTKVAVNAPVPEVLVPKSAPQPQPTPEPNVSSEFVPANPPEPTAKIKAPKVRPIEPTDLPPPPVEIPKEAPKVAKTVIREVPGVTPADIDSAIKKGAHFLLHSTPTWFNHDAHRLGYAALGGLTLLECQVPKSDPVVRQAADIARKLAPTNDMTYEIALTIFFLDRLGESRDRDLIRTLGARLVAGQDAGGGFTYSCPPLSGPETAQLLAYLDASRPRTAPAPLSIDGPDKAPRLEMVKGADDELDPFATRETEKALDKATDTAVTGPPPRSEGDGALISQPPKIRPKNRLGANVGVIRLENKAKDPAGVGARLLQVPAIVNRGRDKSELILAEPETIQTDHSNLQFAVLGMWIARRHGVVSDRALLLAEARMRKMQLSSGAWLYKANTPSRQPEAMTCAGLLCLALGHAAHQAHPAGLAQALTRDPHIERAMKYLGQGIANPQPDLNGKIAPESTYLLWSVERVAVLFNSTEIEGKDWYGWGAQILIKNQDPDGSWKMEMFHGATPHVDSCFALLFLARSNLVQEITEQIRLQTQLRNGR